MNSLNMQFYRAIPSGSTITVSAKIFKQIGTLLYITAEFKSKTKPEKLFCSGNVIINTKVSISIFDYPIQSQKVKQEIENSSLQTTMPIEKSKINKENFPFIQDEKISELTQSNIQQALFWVDRNQNLENQLHPTEFSATIMDTARFTKVEKFFFN